MPTQSQLDEATAEVESLSHEILTVDELAQFLRVNRKTVYDAIARGEIPGVRRMGGVLRIHRGTVLAWLASGQGRVSRSSRRTR